MSKGRVLLAMSGGLDSSVAAMLLLEQGYELVGVTYRAWDSMSKSCIEKETGCCTADAIFGAKELAGKLGFQHHIIDFRDLFKQTVIRNFVTEYLAGRTPNPCVVCNAQIKWGELMKKADETGCQFIATGHYARIKTLDNRIFLAKGRDMIKDQSYFLWMIGQEQLQRTIFPLGNYEKSEIRMLAAARGYTELSRKRESQEICFIPDDDYRRFLREYAAEHTRTVPKGDFVSPEGKKLGQHSGYPFYTVGQRRGLGIALGQPAYVLKINAQTNQIIVGEKEALRNTQMLVGNVVWGKIAGISGEIEAEVKIRYRTTGIKCLVRQDADKLTVTFCEPVYAVTPGQSAVFYQDDDVLAGGVILDT